MQFAALAQERGNAKVLYAGSWSNDAPNGAVYKTTDGGKKWTPSGSGLVGGKVGLLRSGPAGTIYAWVPEQGVFRTTNGGGNWSPVGSGLPAADVREIAVDPQTAARLFVATKEGLFRSSDGGASWAKVGGLEDDDIEAVVFEPGGKAIDVGNFGGVFRSTDGGETWQGLGDGLVNTDVRALAIAGSPARLWVGTAGGGVVSRELP